MLEVSDLSVSYGMHQALSGINIKVMPGEIVVILGANGAGKSSLLKAIAGTSEGSVNGEVTIDGTSIKSIAAELIVERGIAYVPEGRGIFGDLSVGENLLLGAYSKHARPNQAVNLARVHELFPKLMERRSQIARTMSGGEQQMVAIGRAMMADPEILMLDEPSLGLSPLLCKELFQNLSHIRETGMGVLLVEQNAKQSLAIADRGYLLENGEIIGENSASALLLDTSVQRAYLGGAAASNKPEIKVTSNIATAGDEGIAQPTQSVLSFINPGGNTTPAKSSDTLAGETIASLVSRASNNKKLTRIPKEAGVVPPGFDTSGSKPAPDNAVQYSQAGNSDLQRMLNDMEAAAARAANGSTVAKQATRVKPLETYHDLPKIEIFRKNKIEIYRRTPGGDMNKVEDN